MPIKLTRKRIILGVIGAFIALSIIGAAISPPEDEETASAEPTATTPAPTPADAPASTSAPASNGDEQPEAEEKPKAKTEEKPKAKADAKPKADEDTGRMDDGEWATVVAAADRFADENAQYGRTMKKCAVLMQAMELAAVSECMDEAYSGFQEDAEGLYYRLDGLQDDTRGKCRAAVQNTMRTLDAYASTTKLVTEFGRDLDLEALTAGAPEVAETSDAFAASTVTLIAECAPQS